MAINHIEQLIATNELETALELIETIREENDQVMGQILRSRILEKQGKIEEALLNSQNALNKATVLNSLYLEIQARLTLSSDYIKLGRAEEAKREAEIARAIMNRSELSVPKEKGVDLKFRLFFNLGYAYDLLGDLRSSMSYYQLILEFIDEIENKRLIPHVYNNIGEIYRLTGELPEALKYYNLSLDMREQFGELRGAAVCHVNLGIVYSRMSLVKTAISHLKMGFEMFQELGNDLDTAEAMYHYILALLSSQVPNEIEEGIQLVEELKLLDIKTQNRRVSLFYRIITAVVLRQKNRSKYYAQAQEILEGIRSEKMIEFEFHIFAMLNLAELLFIEYKSIPSKEVYDDLYNLVQDLYKTAQEQLSYNVLVQILIILAKLAFISNQVRKAMLLLDQADLVTIEHDLKTLTVIVQTEREFMNKQLTKLSQIITHHDVQHKIEISELSEYMRDLTKMFK